MQHFYKYIKQYAFYKGYKVSIEVIIITQIISSFEQFFSKHYPSYIYSAVVQTQNWKILKVTIVKKILRWKHHLLLSLICLHIVDIFIVCLILCVLIQIFSYCCSCSKWKLRKIQILQQTFRLKTFLIYSYHITK